MAHLFQSFIINNRKYLLLNILQKQITVHCSQITFMTRKILLCTFLLCFSLLLKAQNGTINLPRALRSGQTQTNNRNNTNRGPLFFIGGNVNNNFGYNLALAPEIGVRPTDWLRIGVGPRYELQVLADKTNRYATNAFGASAFVEGIIIDRILIHAGYEFLNYPVSHSSSIDKDRNNLHACALGVGYFQRLSDNLDLYALYVIYPFLTPNDYYNPLPMFARIGISYDF